MGSLNTRVLIIGGGIMGTSSALTLARAGAEVTVLEKAVPGAEASSAAAGILGAEIETDTPGPLLDLSRRSRELFPEWVRGVERESGVATGYSASGALHVYLDADSLAQAAARRSFQSGDGKMRVMGSDEIRTCEPELTSEACGALSFPSDAKVSPPQLFRATYIAARRAGVRFVTGAQVTQVETEGESGLKVAGARLDDGSLLAAERIIVAAGSWTPQVRGLRLKERAVIPARGQIVEVRTPAPLLEKVVFGAGVYLIPRSDGTLLIGSTLEFVGFQKGVTAGAVRRLLEGAERLVPALGDAELGSSWSNFRPYTEDHLPYLGATEIAGLFIAAGHYRTGILLAPVTAEVMRDLCLDRPPSVSLQAFRPDRA